MVLRVLALISVVAAAAGAVVPVHLAPAAHVYVKPAANAEINAEEPAHYEFEYSVNDPTSGDIKHQKETREDDVVQGIYSFLQPDGLQRIVEYSSSLDHGFNAVVRFEKPKAIATVAKVHPDKYVLAPAPIHAPVSAKLTYAPTSEVVYPTHVPAISRVVYTQSPQYAYVHTHTPQVLYAHTPQDKASHVTYYSHTPLSQSPQVLIQAPQVPYSHTIQDNQDNYQVNRPHEADTQVEYSEDAQITNPVSSAGVYSQTPIYQEPSQNNYAPTGMIRGTYFPTQGQLGRIVQRSKSGKETSDKRAYGSRLNK